MTADDIDVITLEDTETTDTLTVDAECLNCGVKTRFTTSGTQAVGDEFRHRCIGCGSGRWPLLGNRQWFRVIRVDPDREYPNESEPVDVFRSSNSENEQ